MEENLTQTPSTELVFEITNHARLHLLSISKWMKFFYVCSIVGVVFVAVMGIAYIFAGKILLGDEADVAGTVGPIVGVFMLLMDAFFVYVTHYLGKAAKAIKESLPGKDSAKLEVGLGHLKKTIRTYGVFCIALLGLYAVMLVVLIIVGVIAAIMA